MPIVVLLLLALFLGVQPVHADVFAALPLPDTHDAMPGDGLCADSGGSCTLRAAIEEANGYPGADTITLLGSKYNLGLGELDVTEDLTIEGVDYDTTIDAHRLGRMFSIENPDVSLIVNHVAMVNGETPEVGGLINN